MKTILLGQSKGKREINEDNFIDIELPSKAVVMPTDTVTQTLDSYKEYITEKDSSEIYRLIFTINPICTNVLFNAITEVVYQEGSDNCKSLAENNTEFNKENDSDVFKYLRFKGWGDISSTNIALRIRQAILDTAFSHPELGHMEYHCGADIFDNHMLRKRGFSVINKVVATDSGAGTTCPNCGTVIPNGINICPNCGYIIDTFFSENSDFNTIRDHLRDSDGKQITEQRVVVKNNILSSLTVNRHVYLIDDVKTFYEALTEGLTEENGWKGFVNTVSLNIPNVFINDKIVTVNKCMNDRNAGDFIDMYPDRSLYSFVPKYNKYRDRLEYNWDYVITYPSEEVYNNSLVSDGEVNGIECIFADIEEAASSYFARGNNGDSNFIIHFKTKLKNTFYKGSFLNFTFYLSDSRLAVTTDNLVKVEGIGYNGDDTQHAFSVNFDSIFSTIDECFSKNGITINATNWRAALWALRIRVRKNVKGADCKYYLRIFKPLPNVKGKNIETNETVSTKFSNSLNKLAFAENIYSDAITQIVFNDDIVTSEVRDNKNRKISELYLTIIKRNKGHQKWYNGTYAGADIEYSHCFGEVSAGIDLGVEWEEYNIHKLTAANRATNALKIENYGVDITEADEKFAGDIVEFSPYTIEETVIEPVYYRFNTAQRETNNPAYGSIKYCNFIRDDYDVNADNLSLSPEMFTVEDWDFLNVESGINICNEGYYYKPHYQIKLRTFDENVKQGRHIKLAFKEGCEPTLISGDTYEFTTNVPNYLSPEQTFIIDETGNTKTIPASVVLLIEPETGKEIQGTVVDTDGFLNMHVVFSAVGINDITKYDIYRQNPAKPDYAYELKDGTGRYLWREILSDSKIMPGDELYDSVFTNGAHYFHTNINFYLKRQDPTGIYGINGTPYPKNKNGENVSSIDIATGSTEGKQKDVSFAEYIEEAKNDIC